MPIDAGGARHRLRPLRPLCCGGCGIALRRGGERRDESDVTLVAEGEEGLFVPHGAVPRSVATPCAAIRPDRVVSKGPVEQVTVQLQHDLDATQLTVDTTAAVDHGLRMSLVHGLNPNAADYAPMLVAYTQVLVDLGRGHAHGRHSEMASSSKP